jgi:hypothetical protein
VLGLSATAAGDAQIFELVRGAIKIVSPNALGEIFPGVQPPKLPWVAAAEFLVADLGVTREYLQNNGFNVQNLGEDSLWLDATQADGAVVIFSPA